MCSQLRAVTTQAKAAMYQNWGKKPKSSVGTFIFFFLPQLEVPSSPISSSP